MRKRKIAELGKRLLSSLLVTTLLLGGVTATDIYYNYSDFTAKAATTALSANATSESNTVSPAASNISTSVINDTSSGNVQYYFNGSSYPFLQLNAAGASSASSFNLTGSASALTRELVGYFAATKASWSSTGTYTEVDMGKPRYALDATSIWNGAGGLAKSVSIATNDQMSTGSYTSGTVSNTAATVFLPSRYEYAANTTVGGMVYSKNSSLVWSRSLWGLYGGSDSIAWCVNNASGSLSGDYLDYSFAAVPAFNLDLSKVLIARSATSGASAPTSKELSAYTGADDTLTAVKFLAKTGSSTVTVTGISDGSDLGSLLVGGEYTFDYTMTDANYLTALIMDGGGKILYMGSLASGSTSGSTSIVIPSLSDGDYYLCLIDEIRNAEYNTDTYGNMTTFKFTAYSDKHTGVNLTDNNADDVTPGDKIKTDNISGTYTSQNNTLNDTVSSEDIYVISSTDWERSQFSDNTYLAKSIEIPSSTSGEYYYYIVVKDATAENGYWVSEKQTVKSDYHTGVEFVNNTDTNLSLGDTVYASDISGTFTSQKGTMNTAVSSDSIYIVSAENWEGYEDKSNANLVKQLTIPNDLQDTAYKYYAVVLDTNAATGYWASSVQTIDVSENATGFDANVWYEYHDTTTNILWNYKLDGNGDVIGLYTTSSIVKIVDSGKTLNIPAKINGRTVVKIGGGTEDTPVIPASEKSWTALSLPSTVTTINDFAFIGSNANANIVIPSTVTNIGIKAFYESKIVSVKISEMDGAIGTYAFGKTEKLDTVTIRGGESGLVVSSVAFADTSAKDVSVRGNVTINKKAFRNNSDMTTLSISGNVTLDEAVFVGCSGITSLDISGNTVIGAYAFSGLTSLENLYLPEGTQLTAYSFDGLTSLTKLEADVNLPANSFNNCPAISTLILDSGVGTISYDWESHTSSVSSRTVYIRNADTQIEYYGKEGTYYSAMGSSGNVTVYVVNGADSQGLVIPVNGVLTLNGYSSYAHNKTASGASQSVNYSDYYKGTASEVTFFSSLNIDTQMGSDSVTNLKDAENEKTQTGIDAYYSGAILTTKDIDKSKMTVVKMYGSEEGEAYSSSEYYVVRTDEFNTEAAKVGGVTEDAIAAYEPVHATDSDLGYNSNTGSISVTVVVFYDSPTGTGETERKYFSTPVSVRVEEYTAKSYIEQVYGSYDAIADRLVALDNEISLLKSELAKADVDSVEDLTDELNSYKLAYAEIVNTLNEYVNGNQLSANEKYFGTTTDANSGNTVDVVYINGNPTKYEDTGASDTDGNTIYKVSYDTDGDGVAEDVYIVVKDDGVHLVTADGTPVTKDDGTEIVYKDTLGALERQMTAQLNNIKLQLEECEENVGSIKDALTDAGFDFDTSVGADDDYTQIVKGINSLNSQVTDLSTQLSQADSLIESYADALDTIYNKLTGSTLSADNISGLTNSLNAIVSKIQGLQNDLTVAKATVADLQKQLDSANDKVSQLQTELDSTKQELDKADAQIDKIQSEKDSLTSQYEAALAKGDTEAAAKLQAQITEKNAALEELNLTKANLEKKEQDLKDAQDTVKALQKQIEKKDEEIATLQTRLDALSSSADGFKMTVDTANSLFGLSLASNSTDAEVLAAIQNYVAQMTELNNTIASIQELVGSSNTGDELVADVRSAIGTSSLETGDDEENDTVDKTSASYKSGYADGVASVDVSETSTPYKNGYAAGLKAGASTGTTNTATSADVQASYNSGYQAGFIAGTQAVSSGTSSSDTATSTLATQIGTLSSQISTLSSKNESLTNQVTELTNENNSLKENIASLENTVEELENKPVTVQYVTTGAQSTNVVEDEPEEEAAEDTVNVTVIEETTTLASTGIIAAHSSTDSSMLEMGVSKQIELPTSLTKDSTQKASSIINDKISEFANITTNAQSFSTNDQTSKNNASKIVAYYADNLSELANLGWQALKNASTDKDKEVTFDKLVSVSLSPSASQSESIKAGESAQVTMTSSDFEDGSTYLVIHESNTRSGIYDILLTRANGNNLSFSLKDLSPVTVVKVSINDSSSDDTEITTTQPEALQTATKDNSKFRKLMYMLIVLAVLGLAAVGIAIKNKGANVNPFKKNKK